MFRLRRHEMRWLKQHKIGSAWTRVNLERRRGRWSDIRHCGGRKREVRRMGRKTKVRVAAAAAVAAVAVAAGLIAVAGSAEAAAPRVTIYSYSKFSGQMTTLYTWDDDLGNNTW